MLPSRSITSISSLSGRGNNIRHHPISLSQSLVSPMRKWTVDSSSTRLHGSHSSNDSEDNDPTTMGPKVIDIESLSPSQIVELIELSFLQGCLGMSKGDIEPLQLFIVAVMTAKKQQSSVHRLLEAIQNQPTKRTLDQKEESIRRTWIQAIYLLLSYLDDKARHTMTTTTTTSTTPTNIIMMERWNEIDNDIVNTYGLVLEDLISIKKSGLGLNPKIFVERRKDIFFPQKEDTSSSTSPPAWLLQPEQQDEEDHDYAMVDPVSFAIVSQTIKVLFYTLMIVNTNDTNDADDNDDGGNTDTLIPSNEWNPSPLPDMTKMMTKPSSSSSTSSSSRRKNRSDKNSRGRGFGG